MNPKQFLQIGGIILVVVGVLGFFLIGPTPEGSIFGANWYFDNGENWAHLIIGIVALIFAYGVKSESAQKNLTVLAGIIALVVGVWGFFLGNTVSPNFFGANLENPLDNILHLIIGVWALWAAFKKPATV